MNATPSSTCPECGARFRPAQIRQLFCAPACKKAHANRQLGRARVVALAQAWRAGRHASDPKDKEAASEAFGELCRALDAINAEDRAAGRLGPIRLYRRRKAVGLFD